MKLFFVPGKNLTNDREGGGNVLKIFLIFAMPQDISPVCNISCLLCGNKPYRSGQKPS